MTLPISIVYGALTISDATSDYYPIGSYGFEEDREQGIASFTHQFIVRGTSAADLQTNLAAMKTELEKFSQSVTVTINSQTVISWSHSGNTGFASSCKFSRLLDHPANGTLAEAWTLTITVGLAASQRSGRRHASWAVSFSPSRIRTVTLTATFTALSSNDALAQYQAAAGMTAFEDAVKAHTGITNWRRVEEDYSAPDTSASGSAVAAKTLAVTRVYQEITADQYTGAAYSTAAFVSPEIFVHRKHDATMNSFFSGYFPEVGSVVTCIFSSPVNHELVPTAAELEGLYESTLVPYLTALVSEIFGLSHVAIVSEFNGIDRTAHAFRNTTLIFRCAGKTGVLSFSFSETYSVDPGILLVPLSSGGALDYSKYQGPARVLKGISVQKLSIAGTASPLPDLSLAADIAGLAAGSAAASETLAAFANNPAVQALAQLASVMGGVGQVVYTAVGFQGTNEGAENAALASLKPIPLDRTLTRVPLYEGIRGTRELLLQETFTALTMFISPKPVDAEQPTSGGGNIPDNGGTTVVLGQVGQF